MIHMYSTGLDRKWSHNRKARPQLSSVTAPVYATEPKRLPKEPNNRESGARYGRMVGLSVADSMLEQKDLVELSFASMLLPYGGHPSTSHWLPKNVPIGPFSLPFIE